jgi:KipI family sensor histidine kinase inhibitor
VGQSARGPRLLPVGDAGVLAEFDDPRTLLAAYRALSERPPDGVLDLVPAARTLLVTFDRRRTSPERVGALFADAAATRDQTADQTADQTVARQVEDRVPARPAEVVVPVCYDGPDLEDVSALTGLSVAEVVARHTAPVYTVAFCGFAPGFAYLDGLDPRLAVPRRQSPRVRVPPGSVAVADRYTGVYPSASPGGWRLLGRTDAELWNLERRPPALLSPGTRVRFRPIPGGAAGTAPTGTSAGTSTGTGAQA